MARTIDIYGGKGSRDVPAHSVVEAAGFLRLPTTTLRQWVIGSTMAGKKRRPVIPVPGRRPPMLSFWNLAEAHVLAAIRRQHGVSLQSVRKALEYVARELKDDRPLITRESKSPNGSRLIREGPSGAQWWQVPAFPPRSCRNASARATVSKISRTIFG